RPLAPGADQQAAAAGATRHRMAARRAARGCGARDLPAASVDAGVQAPADARLSLQPRGLQLPAELPHRLRSPGRPPGRLPASRRLRSLVQAQPAARYRDFLAQPELLPRARGAAGMLHGHTDRILFETEERPSRLSTRLT